MYVIGISSGIKAGHHDGAAVLMKDGSLIAASEEERFSLAKHARGELPIRSITFCLQYAGINIQDVSYICSPLITYSNYNHRIKQWLEFHLGFSPDVLLYDHHMCHAASTFYGSGFEEATILCLDASGDSSAGIIAHGKNGKMVELTRFDRDNSLGFYYGMITQYLGFQMTNDEYKMMGLASYGDPIYLDLFDKILHSDGFGYRFNSLFNKRQKDSWLYTTDLSTRQERIFSDDLEDLLGKRRLRGEKITKRHKDIAASAQKALENVAIHLTEEAIKRTNCPDVCIAGGVGLNCKMNMEIMNHPSTRNVYVPPVPNDPGVALGAAMLCCVDEGNNISVLDHAYYGPEYSPELIRQTLIQIGASFTESNDPVESCVEDIIEQKKVGWYQGRMEFGPRALGNRSILADPRNLNVKDEINSSIKYREEFRPFCPSVLIDEQSEYFVLDTEAPFMVVTFPANNNAKKTIPAVVHVDDTSRIQSVRDETNPMFHELINRFNKDTGVPVLLNTSLNINEQPMVNSPLEAIHTFFCSGLDVIYLGPFRLKKPTNSK